MAEVVLAITDTQLSTVEWSLMLADQLYCTFFLVAKLYSLGWGWWVTALGVASVLASRKSIADHLSFHFPFILRGDSKRISGSLLESIKLVLVSALASFVSLIGLQLSMTSILTVCSPRPFHQFIPTCFLITLIIFQVNQLNQVVQGFVFVTCECRFDLTPQTKLLTLLITHLPLTPFRLSHRHHRMLFRLSLACHSCS